MSAVEELSSGQPTGHRRGPQPYRRQARRARKIDFTQLDGLSRRADQELRETEDALISFIEAQEKRNRLYVKSREELQERFQFGRMGGVA
jgi:hypothetical protein